MKMSVILWSIYKIDQENSQIIVKLWYIYAIDQENSLIIPIDTIMAFISSVVTNTI